MIEFHQTRMGQYFFEKTMPTIATSLNNIASVLQGQAKSKTQMLVVDYELEYYLSQGWHFVAETSVGFVVEKGETL